MKKECGLLTGFGVGRPVGFIDGVLVCKKRDESVSVIGLNLIEEN